jgi:adenylate cyclase
MSSSTFLFADLAGFTALTEAHGDEEAAEVAEEFCGSVRALLPEHGAEEVKSIGDALMIRADDASSAVRLGLRIVEELGTRHGVPGVRVGMHTGPAVERGQDWFGATVNIAARVSAAGASGEVLVTRDTRDAAAAAVPDLEFDSAGPHELKHISRPLELFRAGGPAPVRRALAVDPVCHMTVDPAHAARRLTHRGREHLFCSEACAETFRERPTAYLGRPSRSELLASDSARERGSTTLRRAYERGRITVEELDERLARVWVARTRGDLAEVLRDLPEHRRARRAARRRAVWRSMLPPPFRRR